MRVLLWSLLVVPRTAIAVWAALDPARWQEAFPSIGWLAIGWFLLPFGTLVWVIVSAGGLDLVDYIVLVLAVISDGLTYLAKRFDIRYGRRAEQARKKWDQAESIVADGRPIGPRSPMECVGDAVARCLPWPGMRLKASVRGWPATRRMSLQHARLIEFLAFDSTSKAMLASTPAWLAVLLMLAYVNNSTISRSGMVAVAVIGPILTIGLIMIVGGLNAQFRVVYPLVRALGFVYRSNTWPPTTKEIRQLNRTLGKIADALQRLPLRLGSPHPSVCKAGADKAAAIRDLQEHATWGNPSERESLTRVLQRDLETVLEGRWRDLPDGTAAIRTQGLTAWQKAAFVLLAVVFGSGATWVSLTGESWGPGSGLLISILVALAVASLIRSGVAPGGLQQAIDLSKGIRDG